MKFTQLDTINCYSLLIILSILVISCTSRLSPEEEKKLIEIIEKASMVDEPTVEAYDKLQLDSLHKAGLNAKYGVTPQDLYIKTDYMESSMTYMSEVRKLNSNRLYLYGFVAKKHLFSVLNWYQKNGFKFKSLNIPLEKIAENESKMPILYNEEHETLFYPVETGIHIIKNQHREIKLTLEDYKSIFNFQ